MHHRPSGPPLRARLPGVLHAAALLLRSAVRVRSGRLLLGGVVTTAVTAFVLAVPVVSSGDSRTSVALEASSSPSRSAGAGSPVVLGEDGRPLPAGTATGAPPGTTTPGGEASADTGPTGSGSPSSAASVGAATAGTSGRTSSARTAAGSSSTGRGTPSPSDPAVPGSSTSAGAGAAAGLPSATQPGTAGETTTPSTPPTSTGAGLLALLNEQRAGAGCAALVPDDDLADLARRHSTAMRDHGYLGIADPEGISLLASGGRAAAVAQGDSDAAAVLSGWLADPASSTALLDCGLTSIGLGVVSGDGGPWWTALLS